MYAMPERNNPTAERSAGRLAEGLASAQGMPKQSEDLYRSLVENVPDYAIYLLDPRGLVATWNQGAENSTGYTAEEVIGQSFRMFFLLADAEAGVPERELEAAAQEGCFETSAWRRRKDGSEYWALVTVTAIRNREGELLGFAKVTRDRTEQKQTEEALRNMKAQLERHRIVSENIDEHAIYTLDAEGRVNSWGAAARKATGYSAEEVLGRPYATFFPAAGVLAGEPARELEEAARTGRCLSDGWRLTHAGTMEWVSGVLSALRDESGKLTGYIRVARTMTHQKMMEDSLKRLAADLEKRVAERTRQLESTISELRHKNEEVEAFVYIVSHDLRAPLVNVLGFVNELKMSCAHLKKLMGSALVPEEFGELVREVVDEEIAGALNFISSSSSKFERLIDALLRLSRQGRQVYQRSQVDVSEVVAGIAAGLKPMIDEAGAVVEVGPLPHCYADPAALGQVFSILISNALKYRDPQRQLRMEVGGTEDDRIAHYWIRDNGLGIPEAGKERLFQVFQRLHPQHASGEGMSLAIAHRIVERHEGKIWAESREGEETTFNLTLPRCAQPHPPGDQP